MTRLETCNKDELRIHKANRTTYLMVQDVCERGMMHGGKFAKRLKFQVPGLESSKSAANTGNPQTPLAARTAVALYPEVKPKWQ